MPTASHVVLPSADPELTAALREDLAAAEYSMALVARECGADAADALRRGDAAPARHRLSGAVSTAAALIRLLWFGDVESSDAIDAALPRCRSAGLVGLGLAAAHAERVEPLATVRAVNFRDAIGTGHWWIASDLDEVSGRTPLRADHVLGVGGASQTLAALIPPVPVHRALDLGCGCGILSLHARRFAEEVVATDISERALRYTELNARLNGVEGISTRRGSLFDPVAGERFGLVASNPPFVITPREAAVTAYEYRDGGRTGDELMAQVVREVPGVLEPDGSAVLLGNWEDAAGMGLERVASWAAELDAWVVERERLDPVRYAQLWVRDGGVVPGTIEHARMIAAWLDDFDARGVTGIGLGWIMLHRPVSSRAPMRRVERIGHHVALEHVGAHVASVFSAHDALDALDDDALARAHLRVAPDVTEARHHVPGSDAPSVIELRQGGALARTLEVDPAVAALVGASDGELSVDALVEAIAHLLEVDAASLRAQTLPVVRELVTVGVLLLASAG